MKLIIDIDEDIRVAIDKMGLLRIPDEMKKKADKAIQHGTPIPDNATNGDIVKAMFPNAEIFNEESTCVTLRFDCGEYVEYVDFYSVFWNAPYQKGGK